MWESVGVLVERKKTVITKDHLKHNTCLLSLEDNRFINNLNFSKNNFSKSSSKFIAGFLFLCDSGFRLKMEHQLYTVDIYYCAP